MADSFIPYADLKPDERKMVMSDSVADRALAAQRGWGLDVLVVDEDATVRSFVALHEYRLDKLVDDIEPEVRSTVASLGYGLDELVKDPDSMTRETAFDALAELGMTLDEWIFANPEKCWTAKSKEVFLQKQYEADCAAIDEAVKKGWWVEQDGMIVLDYDFRNEYSLAKLAYGNRDLSLGDYRCVLEDQIAEDWVDETIRVELQICREAGIDTSDYKRTEDARFYIQDKYGVLPPYKELMSQKVKVNIMLATSAEQNLDFGAIQDMCDNLAEGYEVDDELKNNALVKLVEQQGYSFDDLKSAYDCLLDGDFKECLAKHGKFLATVADEMANTSNAMNTVTLLAEVPVGDLPLLMTTGHEFTVDKHATIGIFCPWMGGGSLLEIDLEKPLTIPASLVYDVQIEGVEPEQGYSLNEVYGLVGSAWESEIKIGLCAEQSQVIDAAEVESFGKDKLAAKMEQAACVNAARGERGDGRGHGDVAR